MSSYIYILAPFALGVILAACSSAYCLYIRYSKRKLVERVRAQMLARIIYGADAEAECIENRKAPKSPKSFVARFSRISGPPPKTLSQGIQDDIPQRREVFDEHVKRTQSSDVLSGSELYVNLPDHPRSVLSQASYTTRAQQPSGRRSHSIRPHASPSQMPSRNQPGQAQRIYENAEHPRYRQSSNDRWDHHYNRHASNPRVPYTQGSLSSLRQ